MTGNLLVKTLINLTNKTFLSEGKLFSHPSLDKTVLQSYPCQLNLMFLFVRSNYFVTNSPQ